MDKNTAELLRECSSGCHMAIGSMEQVRGAVNDPLLKEVIDEAVRHSARDIKYGDDKLRKAMLIMILAYRSSYLKSEMESELRKTLI